MIRELHIQNFKSHGNTLLSLNPLTLLSGLNGSGKSSVIQSLLLLRQSHKKQRLNEALILNGSFCSLGTGKDVMNINPAGDFVQIAFNAGCDTYGWRFAPQESKDNLPVIQKYTPGKSLENISLFNNDFQYLSAERLPELKYGRGDIEVENERQLSSKYGYGDLVAQFLYHWENEPIKPALRNSLSPFVELLPQVIAWEREISPHVNIIPKKMGDAYTIHYSFDRSGSLGATDEFKTENVAFGLTYALPVITAILSAKEDALLLIENPEAHLHPRGQSKLAELMALAAQNGVQLIIETHSDHIFNGIRKAIHSKKIDKENVQVYYFDLDETNTSRPTEIQIADNGRILNHKIWAIADMQGQIDETRRVSGRKL
jgi:predicted ATPase